MQHDEVIWQIIRHKHCSFMAKLETGIFCRDPYDFSGVCNRSSCPLANSRYATIRDHDGVYYLYMKTIERAHMPNKLGERVKLPRNYVAEPLPPRLPLSSPLRHCLSSHRCHVFIDKKEGRYNPRMSPYIPKNKWRKGSQWITLIRKHADDEAIFPVFNKLCKRRPPIEAIKGKLNLVS